MSVFPNSVNGQAVRDENIFYAAGKFAPDFVLVPLAPQSSYLTFLIDEEHGVGAFRGLMGRKNLFTRTISILDNRCIAYSRRTSRKRNWLSFVTVVNRWVVMATGCSLVLLAFCFAIPPPKRPSWIKSHRSRPLIKNRFFRNLRTLTESMFSLSVAAPLSFPALFVLWLTSLWVLQQHYGGEMFSMMSRARRLDVIDSFDVLAKKKHLTIVGASDYSPIDHSQAFRHELFFEPRAEYYDDFTSRLEIVDLFSLQNHDRFSFEDGRLMDKNQLDGDFVRIDYCDPLRFRYFRSKTSRVPVHVSNPASQVPYFVYQLDYSTEEEMAAYNDV